ncbi:DUF4263 domain-containing protein [archaeon]|nr:DUF4263 domain-containing protein [archaeon]
MTEEVLQDEKPKIENLDEKLLNPSNLKNSVKDMRGEQNNQTGIPEDIREVKSKFLTGEKDWEQSHTLKTKEIQFSFIPSTKEKQAWKTTGITRLRTLLAFLVKEYEDLDNFDLVFFRNKSHEPFYLQTVKGITTVYVEFDAFQQYTEKISLAIKNLKVSKYYWKVRTYFQKKVLISFFRNEPASTLIDELKNSYHGVIEEILNEYENMPESEEKNDLKSIVMQSKLARDTIKEISELTPESPEKQLILFLKVIPNLPPKEFEILLNNLLKSNKSSEFLKYITNMPQDQLQKIIKKLPVMDTMYTRYEKLSKSLRAFEKLIDEHNKSDTNDEAEIHKFLTRHYWLMGIEYFDKERLSDFDSNYKRTNETKLEGSGKHPDFIIKRLDGFDKCVVIELEDANDRIFKKNGEFSKKVYDGIFQAADYNIEQKFRNYHSKGIAVIGSTRGMKLTDDNKKRFKLLLQEFPNIEILTYDQIIEKAKTTLEFWKKHEVKEIFSEEEI